MIGNKGPDTARKADVVCVVGPTGSGKSALALHLARILNGEIINCDSLQVYRGFDIGTAKPSPDEQAEAAHHLLDAVEPGEDFTAGWFARLGRECVHDITDRGKLALVAGGTGFYLKAMIDGLVEGPPRDEQLRQRLAAIETRSPGRLHRLLARLDPPATERIHAADVQKLIRAIEVICLKKKPLSEVYRQPRDTPESFRVFQVGLNPPRQELYALLDKRCVAMFERGLLQEVQALLDKGIAPDAPPFGSIGYKQALAVLRGKLDRVAALAEMQRDTRRYAKRQWTWFRRDSRVFWVDGFGNDSETHRKVVTALYKRFFWY